MNVDCMENRNQVEYDVMIDGRSVCIVDLTDLTRPYSAWKHIKRFLAMVPASDLVGLRFVVLYDDSCIVPDSVPGCIRGSYGNPDNEIDQARVYIYLNWSLGVYPFLPRPTHCAAWNVLRNRIFIALYGKADLAKVLFHEIGHHRFLTLLKKKYNSEDEEEREVHDYVEGLYKKAFPLAQHIFRFFRWVVNKVIYRRDFQNIVDLWDDWLKKRGYSVNDSRLTDRERTKIAQYAKQGDDGRILK